MSLSSLGDSWYLTIGYGYVKESVAGTQVPKKTPHDSETQWVHWGKRGSRISQTTGVGGWGWGRGPPTSYVANYIPNPHENLAKGEEYFLCVTHPPRPLVVG